MTAAVVGIVLALVAAFGAWMRKGGNGAIVNTSRASCQVFAGLLTWGFTRAPIWAMVGGSARECSGFSGAITAKR